MFSRCFAFWIASTDSLSECPFATLKDTVTTGNCPWRDTVRGDCTFTIRLIAASGTGVAWLVDDVELEPPLEPPAELVAVLVSVGVGVVEASVCVELDDVRADVPFEFERTLVVRLAFDSVVAGEDASAEPDAGMSVACAPLLPTEDRPETLWA